ncbi:crossover junction endodeoxyribonuclease RuvC [Paenibacillus sp. 1P03SA]|uniref:crossover junction endodeoxyribonuclease RuvC n=1 Tax=Paenibacillus sp. 1P03SA TaxID=3132294 RepID=UPI0039A3B8DC
MTAPYRYYLGLDTSLTKTGWAVVKVYDGCLTPEIVDYGLIKSTPKLSDGERLRQIYAGITEVLERYPQLERDISREAGIVRFNLPTKQIFKAHGVTEFALSDWRIHDVNIQTVKAWARRITGSPGKRNDKDMIAEAVRIYFGMPDLKLNKEGDEADAIAVVVSHLLNQGLVAA